MKSLITLVTLLTLSSTVFAHSPERPNNSRRMGMKMKKVSIVKGEKALKIFEAIEAEVETKDSPLFTIDVKKIASLKCVKRIKKSDTSVVKYRCSLKGDKLKRPHGPRRGRGHHDRGRGRNHGRRHGRGLNH